MFYVAIHPSSHSFSFRCWSFVDVIVPFPPVKKGCFTQSFELILLDGLRERKFSHQTPQMSQLFPSQAVVRSLIPSSPQFPSLLPHNTTSSTLPHPTPNVQTNPLHLQSTSNTLPHSTYPLI